MDSLKLGADEVEVRRAVVALGLRHHLVTDFTSLVATDELATAPAGVEPVSRIVPVNPPAEPAMVPVEEMIAVTGESPALEPEPRLDERRLSTGATVSQGELDKIPDTRDPYEILQSEPGAPADRINVGGNESGRQAQWSVDGVVITDMAALGNPPVHFILDPFEKTIPALSEAEAKSLCAEIAQTGWDWITRERALALAPALKGGIEKAYDAGLLRGFLAVALQDTGCAEPPAEVLAEALRYLDRFMPPRG